METNLFGERLIKEESFEIVYQGSSFTGGKILISSLYNELKSLENLLYDSVNLLIETGKIGADCKDFQLYIQVEQGSIKEIFKILFRNKTTIAIIGTFVIPFLNTTYDHFLNRSPEVKGEFAQEIQTIEGDQKFKKN